MTTNLIKRVFLAAGLMLAAGMVRADESELPSILWITSEDHGVEMGCYGDRLATTPNVDALAKRGMTFNLAWSCAPVCAPARTAIISGLYPPSTGSQHMRSLVPLPRSMQFYPRFLREQGYYCTNNRKTDYNLLTDDPGWNESSNKAHYRNRAPGQPFFTIFNVAVSHESRIRARPHTPVHDPANVRVPAYHPDNEETRRDWAQYYDVVSKADAVAGKYLRDLEAAGLSDDTIVFYYADHGSGMSRSKRWTYNSGLQVPMVVYFPEKWQHLAPKEYRAGGRSDRMVNFVDLAPTLLSLAGLPPPGWMQGRAIAGPYQTEPPKYMYGFRDRMDERYDFIRTVTDGRYQYIRNFNPHFIYGQHVAYNFVTPSTAAWKRDFDAGKLNAVQSRFWGLKPAEELYDLQSDRDQVNNLSDSPEHQARLEELRGVLYDWCRRIRDTGFLPEGEIHRRSAGMTPYEMAHDDGRYPFDRIFEAADVATRRDAEALPRLEGFLKDPDSAVRYWGAVGMLNRGETACVKAKPGLQAALRDDSPFVRIVAARALGAFGTPVEQRHAVDVLLELAPWKKDVFVSMAASIALDQLDEKAAFAQERIAAFPRRGKSPNSRYNGYIRNILDKTLKDLEDGVQKQNSPSVEIPR